MARPSRYNVSAEEAGLEGVVLKNKLGITDRIDLEDTETVLLSDAYEHFFNVLEKDVFIFNTDVILEIHKEFLGTLYEWAGQLRTIDISKDGMMFATVKHLQQSFTELDSVIVRDKPTEDDSANHAAKKLAIIHNEFNAIHPFREGNGRTIRLFLDLLATSVGYSAVDYGESTDEYIASCISGMKGDNEPLAGLIMKGLKKGPRKKRRGCEFR